MNGCMHLRTKLTEASARQAINWAPKPGASVAAGYHNAVKSGLEARKHRARKSATDDRCWPHRRQAKGPAVGILRRMELAADAGKHRPRLKGVHVL